MDSTYRILNNFTVRTKEGLLMTLLPKELFYEIMAENGFSIEEEYCEETKLENTGPRTVLRARFAMKEKR